MKNLLLFLIVFPLSLCSVTQNPVIRRPILFLQSFILSEEQKRRAMFDAVNDCDLYEFKYWLGKGISLRDVFTNFDETNATFTICVSAWRGLADTREEALENGKNLDFIDELLKQHGVDKILKEHWWTYENQEAAYKKL